MSGYAEMSARLQEFIAALAGMADEELFQTFRLIEKERDFAKAGNGENESEDLSLKEQAAELEICKRHPDDLMDAYSKWWKGQLL
jgi:replicative superfamily II helicase